MTEAYSATPLAWNLDAYFVRRPTDQTVRVHRPGDIEVRLSGLYLRIREHCPGHLRQIDGFRIAVMGFCAAIDNVADYFVFWQLARRKARTP